MHLQVTPNTLRTSRKKISTEILGMLLVDMWFLLFLYFCKLFCGERNSGLWWFSTCLLCFSRLCVVTLPIEFAAVNHHFYNWMGLPYEQFRTKTLPPLTVCGTQYFIVFPGSRRRGSEQVSPSSLSLLSSQLQRSWGLTFFEVTFRFLAGGFLNLQN